MTTIYTEPLLTVNDAGVQRVNISWSELPADFDTIESFSLTVSSHRGTLIDELQLINSYYEFTDSIEDSASCTVFTFTVSTTVLNYIDNGNCISESIPVRRSLPSLPNITLLETSVESSLSKNGDSVVLRTSFIVSTLAFFLSTCKYLYISYCPFAYYYISIIAASIRLQ